MPIFNDGRRVEREWGFRSDQDFPLVLFHYCIYKKGKSKVREYLRKFLTSQLGKPKLSRPTSDKSNVMNKWSVPKLCTMFLEMVVWGGGGCSKMSYVKLHQATHNFKCLEKDDSW